MAKTSMKIKQARPAKFSTREYSRCIYHERCDKQGLLIIKKVPVNKILKGENKY